MRRKLRTRTIFTLTSDKSVATAFIIALTITLSVIASYADDALVLPKGVFRTTMDGNFYLPIHRRYNPDGKTEPLAIDFNATLNSNIFPALAPLDPFVPGLPSIGDSKVSFEYHVQTLETSVQYGLLDSLSVGVKIPYWWFHNTVKAQIDSGLGSSANVGKNPFFACGSPVCPLFVPGTSRFTTEDVRQLLGKGLDVNGDGTIDIPGFKFKRFQSWTGNGLSDIEAGLRYQYFRSDDWRLAFTGGVRFPTGRVDDPDSLTDYGFGAGAYQLLFRLNHDFVVSNLWKTKPASKSESVPGDIGALDPGDLLLNGTFRYDLVLPDHEKKRIISDVNNPLSMITENVKRNLGDYFEYEISARYGLLKGLNFSALYKYGFKLKDQVSGSLPVNYGPLEEETKATSHIYIVELAYSTLPLYLEKKFPLPISASLSYRNRFAGSDNVLRSQYIGFALGALF